MVSGRHFACPEIRAHVDLPISEQFEEAVTEYTASLKILTAILPPYNRSLSEIHMLIALALDFVPDAIDRAVSHAEQARDILLLKIDQLKRIGKRSDKDEREIIDITELMGDVEMKASFPQFCSSAMVTDIILQIHSVPS